MTNEELQKHVEIELERHADNLDKIMRDLSSLVMNDAIGAIAITVISKSGDSMSFFHSSPGFLNMTIVVATELLHDKLKREIIAGERPFQQQVMPTKQ